MSENYLESVTPSAEIARELYEEIREVWLRHVTHEEELFIATTDEERNRQLDIVLDTLTDDCVMEITAPLATRFDGRHEARQFYYHFITSFKSMEWTPRSVVISPEGVIDISEMVGTVVNSFAGIEAGPDRVVSEWVVFFPWNQEHRRFEGESISITIRN